MDLNYLKNKYCISDIPYTELLENFKNGCKVAILPIGSMEQHGPYLPFGSDTFFAYEFSKKVANATNTQENKPLVMVYPPIWYGNGGPWSKGEIWLRPTTLVNFYADIFEQILKQGFEFLIVINGHGGNSSIIYSAINESQFNGVKPNIFYSCPWTMMDEEINQVKETKITGHACELETSTSLYLFPELVKSDQIIQTENEEPEYWLVDSKYEAVKYVVVEHLSGGGQVGDRPGFVGNPSKSSTIKGEKLVESWTRKLVDFIVELNH
jgi:creatinine amidohydrolase